MNFLSKFLVTVWLGVGTLFGYHAPISTPVPATTLGDYNTVGAGTYRLQSSISSTQTTVTLSSFKEPISNIAYTMSYLNSSIEYATIDPQNTTSKEFVSFTGITQNADGTALLTGVTRGLSPSYPFTASSTFRTAHSGQSIFILSNPPQLYNQFYNLSNVSTSTNTLIFASTTPPRYDLVPINHTGGSYVSTTSEFASIAYVNAISIAGVSNSTESVKGIVELATQLEMASSTSLGSTVASLVLQAKYATSSPYTTGLYIPITMNDAKISPLFIATSSTYTYNWGGNNSYTGTSLFSGLSTFSATSTFATTTQNGAMFGGNIVNTFTGGQTIAGISTPQPVMLATSTGQVSLVDGDVASTTYNFLGFNINNCTTGGTCYVQTDGIVKGFTGLTAGQRYYVSDTAGVLSTTVGTIENYVGISVSTSQIYIDKGPTSDNQFLVTQALSNGANTITAAYQGLWREAIVSLSDDTGVTGEGVLTKVGKSSISISTHDSSGPQFGCTASVSGNVITVSKVNNSASCTGTAYYYK